MSDEQTIGVEQDVPGTYTFTWTDRFTTSPANIYSGRLPREIDMSQAVVTAARSPATLKGLEPQRRYYFNVCGADGTSRIVAQRNVSLEGSVNFRDLGGYRTENGRRVRWGRLFRSGHMSGLSMQALESLAALNLSTVCDFRLIEERAKENAALPAGVRIESVEIPPGVKDPQYFHRIFRETNDPQDVVDAVHEVVRSMVDESAPRYRRLFEVLLESHEQNVLINCSAGKERTGVAAALILTALGVPRETIYYDFMLSRDYFPAEREIPRVLAKYEVGASGELARNLVMPLLETRESYLAAAFDLIDERYGDGLQFLSAQYGIGTAELERLRAEFTE